MNTTDHPIDSDTGVDNIFDSQSLMQVSTGVVVQQIPSRLYLGEGDCWTPDVDRARTFESGATAMEETTHLKLQSFQVFSKR